jgi:multiple sugar transport system ATP-binding protein
VKLPIGTVKVPDEIRARLESGPATSRGSIVAGLRPEHFEDANLVGDRGRGHTFRTKIDVLESMGSEYYAYFTVQSERVSARELDELAQDTGASDLGQSREGSQVVARVSAESRVQQGQEAELWFDPQHLHLFDLESGRYLLLDGREAEMPAQSHAAV